MKVIDEDTGTASLAFASSPQTMLTLTQTASEVGRSTGYDHLVVSTVDIEDATSTLESLGAKVLMPPHEDVRDEHCWIHRLLRVQDIPCQGE